MIRKQIPFVSIGDMIVAVENLPNHSLTLEEYKKVRANMEGFKLLHSKLDSEALRYSVGIYLKNTKKSNPVSYDGVLKYELIPELLDRIDALEKEIELLKFDRSNLK